MPTNAFGDRTQPRNSRSQNSSAAIVQFPTQIDEFVSSTTVEKFGAPQVRSDVIWTAIDELTRCL